MSKSARRAKLAIEAPTQQSNEESDSVYASGPAALTSASRCGATDGAPFGSPVSGDAARTALRCRPDRGADGNHAIGGRPFGQARRISRAGGPFWAPPGAF